MESERSAIDRANLPAAASASQPQGGPVSVLPPDITMVAATEQRLRRVEERTMGAYVKQLECLNCSQSRSFVLHGDREQRIVGQAEAARLIKRVVMTCARCGGSNLIRAWGDAVPFATVGRTRRRRRPLPLAKVVQEG